MPNVRRLVQVGNGLAIDFANSVYPEGVLTHWVDFVEFLEVTGIISPEKGGSLRMLERAAAEEARRVFRLALELRQGLRQVVVSIGSARSIPAVAVEPINAVLRLTEGHDQLVPVGNSWKLEFSAREQRLEWLLAAIARSGAALVEEGPMAPVRKCGQERCDLYFYDDSRTGRRRWCSMATCGNRNKVAAFAKRRMEEARRAKAPGRK